MRDLHSIMALDVSEIERLFAEGVPSDVRMSTNEWLTLIELLTGRVAAARLGMGSADVSKDVAALLVIFNALDTLDILEHSKIVIRRIDLAVALARGGHPLDRVGQNSISPLQATQLFLREVPYSQPETADLCSKWHGVGLETVKNLRYIKNMLRSLRSIESLLPDGEEKVALRQWLKLERSMP
jgi:hypothetical protein